MVLWKFLNLLSMNYICRDINIHLLWMISHKNETNLGKLNFTLSTEPWSYLQHFYFIMTTFALDKRFGSIHITQWFVFKYATLPFHE